MPIQIPKMSPYGKFLGIELIDFAEGQATCAIELKDCHFNNGGRVHGGVLSSLADTAAGAAVRSVRPEGKLSATIDLSISFIRPPAGNTLVAKAEVIHAGKTLFRCEISIYSKEKLVAKTNATFMIVDPLKKL